MNRKKIQKMKEKNINIIIKTSLTTLFLISFLCGLIYWKGKWLIIGLIGMFLLCSKDIPKTLLKISESIRNIITIITIPIILTYILIITEHSKSFQEMFGELGYSLIYLLFYSLITIESLIITIVINKKIKEK